MSDSPSVRVERRGAVQLVTFDRPAVRNAFDLEMSKLVAAAMDELDGDDTLSVGVVTGADGYFSAGMDLKAFARGEFPGVPVRGFAGITQKASDKPLIAAVEGPALAGGFEIAVACDLIVAGESAIFGVPEVRRGLVALAGGLRQLARRVPRGIAKELALTGQPIGAARAAELGLVNRVVADGEALDAALELAATIAANAPLALRATKRILDEQDAWDGDDFWARQGEIAGPVIISADAREGAVAFAEKRDPVWQAR
ncbi:crotonase/enoyl-CoA hydratase family protein [Conexibacter stalactiti]|uniref:Crotonase/enoyl-CoA hydratase family protein n=1 Tax=Conexibacter stalactiti TaxID=1940611 RepID=A0ABU4HNM7_9ACTN|nr:crotonase/enoyl-CoA hydratase family protein [Conexibacter stalactiti]MDW5594917.1 crotonase/enoyl-CoA hydratase family protein [Conexibacter stalactiti]MEC5035559.1 crotonase/enoyl-CoA hydratase family protein [Conexibacter stalactiti]